MQNGQFWDANRCDMVVFIHKQTNDKYVCIYEFLMSIYIYIYIHLGGIVFGVSYESTSWVRFPAQTDNVQLARLFVLVKHHTVVTAESLYLCCFPKGVYVRRLGPQ